MGWTYGDPNTNDKDKVRLAVGDTVETDQLLQDEDILYLLTLGSPSIAAALAARSIQARFARKADIEVGPLRIEYSKRAAAFSTLADELWQEAGGMIPITAAPPLAGGISHAQKAAQEADTDRVAPAFTRNLHEDG